LLAKIRLLYSYVIMENLHHMLSAYDANMPLYFGYQMRRYNVVSDSVSPS